MTDLVIPGLMLAVGLWAAAQRVDLYGALCQGVKSGLEVVYRILPGLVVMLSGISMLRASGCLDALARCCAPVLEALGVPAELAPLMMLRPFSGSGALALGGELMSAYGPDSTLGRTAAVMLGSTETTFYVVGVYFAAAGIRKSRHAVPAALVADLIGFLTAAWSVRLLFR